LSLRNWKSSEISKEVEEPGMSFWIFAASGISADRKREMRNIIANSAL